MTMIQIQAETMPEVLLVSRRAAGLSLRAIAEKVGVTHTTARAWENGLSEPSVAQFIRWSRACNQPALQLLDGLMMSGYGNTPAASATGVSDVRASRDSNPQPSGLEPDRARDDFWSVGRDLSLVELWRQVEPDAGIARVEGVA